MTTQSSHGHVTDVALRSIAIAQQYQHETVALEHILAALLERPDVQRCLKDLGIDHQQFQIEITKFFDTLERVSSAPARTTQFDVVMGRTIAYAQFSARRIPNGLDVLMQLVQMPHDNSLAVSLLIRSGVDAFRLKRYFIHGAARHLARSDGDDEAEPTDKTESIAYIKKYCSDLNELVREGQIDPVIGRSQELDRIIQIVSRRTKNNAVLVGESGVGKTAVIEGLAYNIVHGMVPNVISKSTVWALDVGAVVAGTRLRGDFEERMKFLLKAFALIAEDEPILFIDEIHTIMEAGSGHKGSLDVSNLLKPALARGKLRCIGSTTDKDWRQYFEKDRALTRRFKKLIIDEPSSDDAKLILRGLRGAYGQFHKVTYTDAALDAAVDLTVRYMHDGRLPDKAIDVIDEAGARQRINDGDRKSVIDVADIETEVARVVKIPTQIVQEDETAKLIRLEHELHAVVFGQDSALQMLVDAVLIGRAGLREINKPEGSFLFVGPSGVGKTECARQLAKTLGLPLVKFDMSEYMERHAVSKMIGAPPGYVGFGDGAAGDGLLINAVDMTPACVLLLDEIEKAHIDIFNVLLQVMDDAKLTNSAGKQVNFRNVIVIMTSNIGVAQTEQHAIGFQSNPTVGIDEEAVRRTFTPEFRNRLDAVVAFDGLNRTSITCIVQKFLNQLREMLDKRHVTIELTEIAEAWLADHGHDEVFGARPLGRLIDTKIKQPLSRLILFGPLKHGGIAKVSVENDDIVVSA